MRTVVIAIAAPGDAVPTPKRISSPAPGYQSLGAAGVLTIDRAQSQVVLVQALPASGALRVETLLPNDPALWGTELYYQAYVRDASPSGFHLTNRDRITIAHP